MEVLNRLGNHEEFWGEEGIVLYGGIVLDMCLYVFVKTYKTVPTKNEFYSTLIFKNQAGYGGKMECRQKQTYIIVLNTNHTAILKG